MLIDIDPKVTPDLLYRLAKMGHGDEIAVVDANYPAYAAGVEVIHLPGISVTETVALILGLIPLDDFVDHPIRAMLPTDSNATRPDVHNDLDKLLESLQIPTSRAAGIERFEFYAAARTCSAIVATSDPAGYGCFTVKKGVL